MHKTLQHESTSSVNTQSEQMHTSLQKVFHASRCRSTLIKSCEIAEHWWAKLHVAFALFCHSERKKAKVREAPQAHCASVGVTTLLLLSGLLWLRNSVCLCACLCVYLLPSVTSHELQRGARSCLGKLLEICCGCLPNFPASAATLLSLVFT